MSPIDQEIFANTAKSQDLAIITGEIPKEFIGSGEFRATVAQDGRACAEALWFISPDGTGAGLPHGRTMVPLQNRNHSAYCRITADRRSVRIIIPALDVWSAPKIIYAKVATETEARNIRACYE